MARISKIPTKTSSKPIQKQPAKKLPSAKIVKTKTKQVPQQTKEDFQEVRSLIDLLKKNGLAVLEFAKGDLKITLKTPAGASSGATLLQGSAPVAAPAPIAAAPVASAAPVSAEPAKSSFKEIKSPMVGTFYASSSPEAPAFVEVGKEINPESVVCIIEAMKVMNEIKAEISGKVVEIVAENGKPVQFGEVLFRVS